MITPPPFRVFRGRESGSILFMILIAIVLFGALSYAVTQATRNGGKDASKEDWQAASSDLMQQFSQIDLALLRMQVSGGITPENISFETTSFRYDGTPAYLNNSNCTSSACKLFNTNGGNISDRQFVKYATPAPSGWTATNVMPGYWDLLVMQWPEAKTTANDIAMRYAGLRPGLCDAINNALGITATPTVTGTYVNGINVSQWDNTARSVTVNASQLTGKDTFGAFQSGTGDNAHCTVYHLLISR